jgi:hypothetical protein
VQEEAYSSCSIRAEMVCHQPSSAPALLAAEPIGGSAGTQCGSGRGGSAFGWALRVKRRHAKRME